MAGKYILKKAADGTFVFNLKAGNNEVILTSQTYKARESALAGIESVKTNSANDASYEKKESARKEPYFVLLAPNKQVIGKSEMYSSTTARDKGIASVKSHGPSAGVVDEA